nr:4650_t:CDS:2 [Entrophospora candida]
MPKIKTEYPTKFSGEELNGKEKRLFRASGRYFENQKPKKWTITTFLDYINKRQSHKFPLNLKKEMFIMWLGKKLEDKIISKDVPPTDRKTDANESSDRNVNEIINNEMLLEETEENIQYNEVPLSSSN